LGYRRYRRYHHRHHPLGPCRQPMQASLNALPKRTKNTTKHRARHRSNIVRPLKHANKKYFFHPERNDCHELGKTLVLVAALVLELIFSGGFGRWATEV